MLLVSCTTINVIPPTKPTETKIQNTEDNKLLEKAMQLSMEVKEFEKTLGIEPSEALSKSSLEKPATSLFLLFLQNKGSLAYDTMKRIILQFTKSAEEISISYVWVPEQYSFFKRQTNEFSDNSVISIAFAKDILTAKIETFFHEDFHANIFAENEEALATPVGFIGALKFLEAKEDKTNADVVRKEISKFRKMSRELNELIKNEKLKNIPREDFASVLLDLIKIYPTYFSQYGWAANLESTEAKVGHDLRYWLYFDLVCSIHDKIGDTKLFVAEIKKVPSEESKLEQFLTELEQKYSIRNSPHPLLP